MKYLWFTLAGQTGTNEKDRKRPMSPEEKLDCAQCGADCQRFQGKRPASRKTFADTIRLTVDK